MSFISFNEKYYLRELSLLENKKLDETDICKVKQLLKILDDLDDEGYITLNNYLEGKYHVITRLRSILLLHGEEPFSLPRLKIPEVHYGENEFEVAELCNELIDMTVKKAVRSDNPFLKDICAYSEWIGYDSDTAYVFLFRDALLPYVYFCSRGRENLYPWLISRAFLCDVSGQADVDDEIRLSIYEALKLGITRFSDFKKYCKERINKILKRYPVLEQAVKKLLSEIPQKKIMVIESGYCGTVPMLLVSLDERVDFRLYTTAPFLYDVYEDKIFCHRYEDLRLFETLYSQDVLMKYSAFRKGKFYVKLAQDDSVKEEALEEIYSFL